MAILLDEATDMNPIRPIDATDRQLIALLQANARMSTADLARKLHIARTTVVARLARLERDGVIVGYTARLASDAPDQGVQADVGITVSPKSARSVQRRLEALPELRQLIFSALNASLRTKKVKSSWAFQCGFIFAVIAVNPFWRAHACRRCKWV